MSATVVPLRPDQDEPPEPPRRRVRVKKLRLLAVLGGVGLLAVISTVFGMMMAVASDLPKLDAFDQQQQANSRIFDRTGKVRLGLLTGQTRRLLLKPEQPIAPSMRQAIIAIEDRRFYSNPGVDFRGIARALWQDVASRKVVQGGSTITQQFVKNALEAQNKRTLFQKLRESAMAYHMTRKWEKERILRAYLNTIYFGNGAYGIESAAQVYFGFNHGIRDPDAPPLPPGVTPPRGCDRTPARPCAAQLEIHESALLAGVVANPTAYDPVTNPDEATARRELVLRRMMEQGYISRSQYEQANAEPLPTREDVQPPREDTTYPYFTSWVKQQVVENLGGGQVGARRAFEGGLRIHTTIDADLQEAAQQAVNAWLPKGSGPEAAMVAVDNDTGEVLAMVGGPSGGYNDRPFNLATQGQRQPGSAFKPFVLAEALNRGISPNSTWTSRKKNFCVVRRGKKCLEGFEVNNYEDAYAGVTSLANATAFSDNSVYAEIGIKVGTKKVAKLAESMGIRTPVSSNFAMTLGGLRRGVTVLDMANAYRVFANKGVFRYGRLAPGEWRGGRRPVPGPSGLTEIRIDDGDTSYKDDPYAELPDGEKAINEPEKPRRILKPSVANQVSSLLNGVVRYGTGERAQLPENTFAAGKTGTTENYGDAWFVGWTDRYTVAVWVGYPDRLVPMQTEFRGEPVAGGTFPAAIWQTFMKSALAILKERRPPDPGSKGPTGPTTAAPAPGAATSTPGAGPAPKRNAAPKARQQEPKEDDPDAVDPGVQPQGQQIQPEEQEEEPPEAGGAEPPPSN